MCILTWIYIDNKFQTISAVLEVLPSDCAKFIIWKLGFPNSVIAFQPSLHDIIYYKYYFRSDEVVRLVGGNFIK